MKNFLISMFKLGTESAILNNVFKTFVKKQQKLYRLVQIRIQKLIKHLTVKIDTAMKYAGSRHLY